MEVATMNRAYSLLDIKAIKNVYPLSYWNSLLPLPGVVKQASLAVAKAMGIAHRPVGMNVGNLLTVARKPA